MFTAEDARKAKSKDAKIKGEKKAKEVKSTIPPTKIPFGAKKSTDKKGKC